MTAGLLALLLLGPPLHDAQDAQGAWPNPNRDVGKTESGHPEVLFTFDDGPHEKNTARVLDTLAKHGVQAIFYAVGYRVAHASKSRKARTAMLDRIVREGHLVGNHTVTHAHLCSVSAKKAAAEIDDNTFYYEQLTRMPMFLFRAPYGDRCDRLALMLKERGFVHDHWDVDPREWQSGSSAATAKTIIRKLRNLKGRAIILLHDTNLVTARALPRVLTWIDGENERRRKKGKKTIRILGGSEWVAQNWEVGLWNLAEGVATLAGARLRESANRLVPGSRLPKSASAEQL